MKKDPEKNKMNASDNEVKAPADTDESIVEEKIDAEPSNAEEVSTAKEIKSSRQCICFIE